MDSVLQNKQSDLSGRRDNHKRNGSRSLQLTWQRVLNENTNMLIRQYVPKGSDIRILTDEHIEHIMERLNDRPRKTVDYLTPNEVFYKRKKLTG